jgi:hypothetical protein
LGSTRLPDRIHTGRGCGRLGCADCATTPAKTAILA